MKNFNEFITVIQEKNENTASVIYNTKTKKQIGKVYKDPKKAKVALAKMKNSKDFDVASELFFIDNISESILVEATTSEAKDHTHTYDEDKKSGTTSEDKGHTHKYNLDDGETSTDKGHKHKL